MNRDSCSNRIKLALTKKDIKQSELCKLTNIPKSAMCQYIKGSFEPRQDRIYSIAKALNVSEAWLMGFDVPMERDSPSTPKNAIEVTASVPIYGSIPAGYPAFEQEEVLGFQPVSVTNPADYFCLRVQGDSMINKGIVDGCVVLIKRQSTAENGNIVACRVNGEEATLKIFSQTADTVVLSPANPEYQPIVVPKQQFDTGEASIYGIVKQVIIDM